VLHVLVGLAMRVGLLGRVGWRQPESRHGHLDGASGRRQSQQADHSGLSSESNHGYVDPRLPKGVADKRGQNLNGKRRTVPFNPPCQYLP
jgi:hypothetical protein